MEILDWIRMEALSRPIFDGLKLVNPKPRPPFYHNVRTNAKQLALDGIQDKLDQDSDLIEELSTMKPSFISRRNTMTAVDRASKRSVSARKF